MTMQGSVEFIESNEFRIEVNATSSSVEELARFHYNFTDFHGSLLLQMVRTAALPLGTLIQLSNLAFAHLS